MTPSNSALDRAVRYPTKAAVSRMLELAEKATPGPWHQYDPDNLKLDKTSGFIGAGEPEDEEYLGVDGPVVAVVEPRGSVEEYEASAQLIAAARTELPDYARAYDGAMQIAKCLLSDLRERDASYDYDEAAAAIAAWEEEG